MSYLRVYRTIFQNAVSAWSQYRVDTLLQIGINIVWFGLQFIFLDAIFTRTPDIQGWTKEMVWLLFVTFPFLDLVYRMLVGGGMWNIPERIINGSLDVFFIKPKSALFLLLTERLELKHFVSLPLQGSVFLFALFHAIPNPTFLTISAGMVLALCGVSILFSVQLFIVCLGFWFPRIENLLDVWYVLLEGATYPAAVFPKVIYYAFATLIPVLFVAFFPAAAFLGVLSAKMVAFVIFMSLGFLVGSISFWHIAISRYSSASS